MHAECYKCVRCGKSLKNQGKIEALFILSVFNVKYFPTKTPVIVKYFNGTSTHKTSWKIPISSEQIL